MTPSRSSVLLCLYVLPLHCNSQEGSKLVGTGYTTGTLPLQDRSVSLSADGTTLAVGGTADDSALGATWIFTRSGPTWTQQGSKLVGTGYSGTPIQQGYSVSLSSNGNTLAVGGYTDDGGMGATWVFTRSGSSWTQQGSKLFATGWNGTYPTLQGASVSLSSDGNTLAVGGPGDNDKVGSTWIFIRSGSSWDQEAQLVGTGYITGVPTNQGSSVSLSADGNTLAVGGGEDDSGVGAVWIFTRSGSTWTQQGSKLVGTGYLGVKAFQGYSVSLSSDGNTLAVGGFADDTNVGATWIFIRSGSSWAQQGSKLVGTGHTTTSTQGTSVSLSSDGNILVVGGQIDNTDVGATWIFTRSGSTWTQQGSKLVGSGYSGSEVSRYAITTSYQGNKFIGVRWTMLVGTGNEESASSRGTSVSLSSDGYFLAVGGHKDNGNIGATWIFAEQTLAPTEAPTESPTPAPTVPTESPTESPTLAPTLDTLAPSVGHIVKSSALFMLFALIVFFYI